MNKFLVTLLVFVVACATAYPVLFSSNDWVVFSAGVLMFILNVFLLVRVGQETLPNWSEK